MEFAGVMDGIVYGSAVGFGFALAEDILYGMQFGAETFVVRRILGGFAHAAFTSLTGIGIGLIPWTRHRGLAFVPPLLGLLGAILRDEAAAGLISPEEQAVVPSYFRRTGYYLRLILSGQLGVWSMARKIHAAEVDLALAKRLARRAPTPTRVQRVQALRQKISNLRAAPALQSSP